MGIWQYWCEDIQSQKAGLWTVGKDLGCRRYEGRNYYRQAPWWLLSLANTYHRLLYPQYSIQKRRRRYRWRTIQGMWKIRTEIRSFLSKFIEIADQIHWISSANSLKLLFYLLFLSVIADVLGQSMCGWWPRQMAFISSESRFFQKKTLILHTYW